jgi:hypothetical protein
MRARSHRHRNSPDAVVAGTPEISAHKALYAVAHSGASQKTRTSAPKARRAMKRLHPDRGRPSAAFGVRLHDAFGAERRRGDKHRIQELNRRSSPCLINAADPSTYRLGKSVRTTRATARYTRECILSVWYGEIQAGSRKARSWPVVHFQARLNIVPEVTRRAPWGLELCGNAATTCTGWLLVTCHLPSTKIETYTFLMRTGWRIERP